MTSDYSEIGKIAKTHGVDGEMTVVLDESDYLELLVPEDVVFLEIEGLYVPFFLRSVRPRGAQSAIIAFDDALSQDQVARYVGKTIYIEGEIVDEATDGDDDGQMYAEDLVGFTAMADNIVIGNISDYDDSTDNPLFILKNADNDKPIYIPIVSDFIEYIDSSNKIVGFNLPDGLLNL